METSCVGTIRPENNDGSEGGGGVCPPHGIYLRVIGLLRGAGGIRLPRQVTLHMVSVSRSVDRLHLGVWIVVNGNNAATAKGCKEKSTYKKSCKCLELLAPQIRQSRALGGTS
jgi:hypothetical protein